MAKHKRDWHDEPTTTPGGQRRSGAVVVGVLAIAIVAALGSWWWAANRANGLPGATPPIEFKSTTAAMTTAAPKVDVQKLKGRWLRPDGGYVIQIKSVDDSGRMEASYSNPGPIHVAKAEASQDAGTLKIFIELRDVNYPGSTYDLTYDPQGDLLSGMYYQAALQQRFEVVFTRMN
jgi:hypothetical protein